MQYKYSSCFFWNLRVKRTWENETKTFGTTFSTITSRISDQMSRVRFGRNSGFQNSPNDNYGQKQDLSVNVKIPFPKINMVNNGRKNLLPHMIKELWHGKSRWMVQINL